MSLKEVHVVVTEHHGLSTEVLEWTLLRRDGNFFRSSRHRFDLFRRQNTGRTLIFVQFIQARDGGVSSSWGIRHHPRRLLPKLRVLRTRKGHGLIQIRVLSACEGYSLIQIVVLRH